jgi:hypothetical protein
MQKEDILMRTRLLISVYMIVFLSVTGLNGFEINTSLMHYTYQIVGPTGKPNEIKYGTVFLMGMPDRKQPDKGLFVLVTAKHILEGISGETAIIYLREKMAESKFRKVPHVLQIRKDKEPLWVCHPSADVAVMKITMPNFISKQAENIPILSTNLLADDAMMERFEIHPGDELLCLGYPLRTNVSGFSILRSGKIASYPLTPAKNTKVFLFDFEVFLGNSGGPVYFVDEGRTYGGTNHVGETIQFVAGIVTRQHEELRLAVVVPAHFIKETLALIDKE